MKQLQHLLKQLGYYDGEVDGKFGPKTKKAFEQYNAKIGKVQNLDDVFRTFDKAIGVPLAARQLSSHLLGNNNTVLKEDDLTKKELNALRKVVRDNLKKGKNVIEYNDYGTSKNPYDDVGAQGVSAKGMFDNLQNPFYNLKTTLGQANIVVTPQNDTLVVDQYDFNNAKNNGIIGSGIDLLQQIKSNPNAYGIPRAFGTAFGAESGKGNPVIIRTNEAGNQQQNQQQNGYDYQVTDSNFSGIYNRQDRNTDSTGTFKEKFSSNMQLPQSSQPSAVSVLGSDLGFSNNNPGNIKGDDGEFRVFDTIDDGFNHMLYDLSSKQAGRTKTGLTGKSSISDLINIWSPVGAEQSQEVVDNYINHVTGKLGKNSNTPIGELNTKDLAAAMTGFESPASYQRLFGDNINKKQQGGYINTTGYTEGTETANNPFNIIPSGNITMQGVNSPILAQPNIGQPVVMQPGTDYNFPNADYVVEQKLNNFKNGGNMKNLRYQFGGLNAGPDLENDDDNPGKLSRMFQSGGLNGLNLSNLGHYQQFLGEINRKVALARSAGDPGDIGNLGDIGQSVGQTAGELYNATKPVTDADRARLRAAMGAGNKANFKKGSNYDNNVTPFGGLSVAEVKEFQQDLKDQKGADGKSLYRGKVDGMWGKKTWNAVDRWEDRQPRNKAAAPSKVATPIGSVNPTNPTTGATGNATGNGTGGNGFNIGIGPNRTRIPLPSINRNNVGPFSGKVNVPTPGAGGSPLALLPNDIDLPVPGAGGSPLANLPSMPSFPTPGAGGSPLALFSNNNSNQPISNTPVKPQGQAYDFNVTDFDPTNNSNQSAPVEYFQKNNLPYNSGPDSQFLTQANAVNSTVLTTMGVGAIAKIPAVGNVAKMGAGKFVNASGKLYNKSGKFIKDLGKKGKEFFKRSKSGKINKYDKAFNTRSYTRKSPNNYDNILKSPQVSSTKSIGQQASEIFGPTRFFRHGGFLIPKI